ncbi:MAG: ABC transporter permease [Pirellulales bacterium]
MNSRSDGSPIHRALQLTGDRGRLLSLLRTLLGPFVGLMVVVLLFHAYHLAFKPETGFLTAVRLQLITKQTAIVGMGALGMTVIIISGGIDLSAGSLLALTAVVLAVLLRKEPPAWVQQDLSWLVAIWTPLPPILLAAVVLGVGMIAGALNGVLITWIRLVPFIVTLGTMLVFRGTAEWVANQQKVVVPDVHAPEWISTLLDPPPPWQLVCTGVWLVLALGLVLSLILRLTVFGRYVFAIGSNESTARLCGVPVTAVKIAVYALGGLFMALAGIFDFNDLNKQGSPTSGIALELEIIAAVVIGGGSLNGGRGSVLGSIIGALTMTTLRSGCDYAGISNPTQKIVIGGIIITAVAIDQYLHRRS